jgi:amino acid permease
MPLNFVNGGWLFSAICIVLSMFWTLYCAKLLITTHEKVGGGSFPEIGLKVYGKTGKILTDISLFFS